MMKKKHEDTARERADAALTAWRAKGVEIEEARDALRAAESAGTSHVLSREARVIIHSRRARVFELENEHITLGAHVAAALEGIEPADAEEAACGTASLHGDLVAADMEVGRLRIALAGAEMQRVTRLNQAVDAHARLTARRAEQGLPGPARLPPMFDTYGNIDHGALLAALAERIETPFVAPTLNTARVWMERDAETKLRVALEEELAEAEREEKQRAELRQARDEDQRRAMQERADQIAADAAAAAKARAEQERLLAKSRARIGA